MTIKGVMISNQQGQLIFYRNYSELNHVDFEDLAYQLGHSENNKRQQTYIQHMSNRIVFLMIEELFISLVTTSDSNIIQDQKTLALCKEVLQMCNSPKVTEDRIQQNFIEIAFGLDDVINMGTSNNVTLEQVEESQIMQSSNEAAHLQMMNDKVKERQREVEEESREIEKNLRIREMIEQEKQQIENSISKITNKDFQMNQDEDGNVTSFNNDDFLKNLNQKNSEMAAEEISETVEDNTVVEESFPMSKKNLVSGVLGKKTSTNVKKAKGARKKRGLKLGGDKKGGKKGRVL